MEERFGRDSERDSERFGRDSERDSERFGKEERREREERFGRGERRGREEMEEIFGRGKREERDSEKEERDLKKEERNERKSKREKSTERKEREEAEKDIINTLSNEFDNYFQILFDKIEIDDIFDNFLINCNLYNNEKSRILSKFSWMKKTLTSLFDISKNLIANIRYKFKDFNNDKFSMVSQIDILDAVKNDLLLEFFLSNINIKTNDYFTFEEYNELMTSDPRLDFYINKDDILFRLPLTLNYFSLYNYKILEKLVDEKKNPLHIKNLIKLMLPEITEIPDTKFVKDENGNRKMIEIIEYKIKRRDAGWEDFIPLMPEILNINIHIVTYHVDAFDKENNIKEKKLKCYRTMPEVSYESLPNRPNIIIRHTEAKNHFEVVAILSEDENSFQSVFESNHPIIENLMKFENKSYGMG